MDEQPNPYEPPQVPAEPGKPAEVNTSPKAAGWWFVGLAIVTLCGLLSFVPGLALLFLSLSAPVYIRYANALQSEEEIATRKPLSLIMRVLATIAFVVGVVAASAGAFLGTCTVTGWPVGLAATAAFNHYLPGIQYGVIAGVACGIAAFIVVCIWLVRRQWETPPAKTPEEAS